MELPHIGEHCSEKSCNCLDFLILKCDACEAIFCTDHISYDGHACPSSYKKDVQVPTCPLCNVPIPSKRGDPPDLAVGLHMDNDCKIDVKNRKKVSCDPIDPNNIRNSIKALAKSVHGDTIFGDLPRPRFSTEI